MFLGDFQTVSQLKPVQFNATSRQHLQQHTLTWPVCPQRGLRSRAWAWKSSIRGRFRSDRRGPPIVGKVCPSSLVFIRYSRAVLPAPSRPHIIILNSFSFILVQVSYQPILLLPCGGQGLFSKPRLQLLGVMTTSDDLTTTSVIKITKGMVPRWMQLGGPAQVSLFCNDKPNPRL